MKRVGKVLANLIYPVRCPVCDRILPVGENDFCGRCRKKVWPIPVDAVRCKRCGKPLPEEGEFCMDCAGKEVSFEAGMAAFLYDKYMQEAVGRFKYRGRREYADVFARYIFREYGGWIRQQQPDVFIPVPVHPERYRQRGYNQAEILAGKLGAFMDVPVWKDYLLRVEDTLPQKNLSAGERKRNLQQAFRINPRVAELKPLPDCVIIIDDIYTTGSTVEACSSALKTLGISKVFFLCLCVGEGF